MCWTLAIYFGHGLEERGSSIAYRVCPAQEGMASFFTSLDSANEMQAGQHTFLIKSNFLPGISGATILEGRCGCGL